MDEVADEEVTLDELIDLGVSNRLIDLHTAFPAKVESYDKDQQTVDVVPQFNRSLPDGQGNFVTEKLPKLADVKVCFPRVGGFFLSLPIKAGDYVLIVCAQRNIGAWRSTGDQGDPGDLGMHTLDGAVAIPGIFPDSKSLQHADGTNMVLGSDADGNSRIEIKPSGGINLGAGASKGVARKDDNLTASAAMAAWASIIEGFVNGIASGTFTPANQFAGSGTNNPGGTGSLGKINGCSSNIKAVD